MARAVNSYFGIVKCHVVPPKNLYHPVLWHHDKENNDKLMFDLNDKIGTWTTVELIKAFDKGYIIDKIYEVWHFEDSSIDLFKSYIQKFLKIKTEAGGWSKWCKTEEQKQAYLNLFNEWHGFELYATKIEDNPGLKNVAKLYFNSLWGEIWTKRQYGKN